jgi:hypothetical protein
MKNTINPLFIFKTNVQSIRPLLPQVNSFITFTKFLTFINNKYKLTFSSPIGHMVPMTPIAHMNPRGLPGKEQLRLSPASWQHKNVVNRGKFFSTAAQRRPFSLLGSSAHYRLALFKKSCKYSGCIQPFDATGSNYKQFFSTKSVKTKYATTPLERSLRVESKVTPAKTVSDNLEKKRIITLLGLPEDHKLIFISPVAQRKEIAVHLINKSGVYCWLNKVNGKKYVGSGGNIYRRVSDYFRPSYLVTKNFLTIVKAIQKYSLNNFTLVILELVVTLGTNNNISLLATEQK